MLLHKAACREARAPANYHNHRQRRKWQDCESFPPCARRTNRGLTIWSVHYSPSAADIISHFIIWRHGGKGSAPCSLYWVNKKGRGKKTRRNVLLRFDFYISACAKEIRSKMMPTTCQKRQHLHLQLSSSAGEQKLAFDSSWVFILVFRKHHFHFNFIMPRKQNGWYAA